MGTVSILRIHIQELRLRPNAPFPSELHRELHRIIDARKKKDRKPALRLVGGTGDIYTNPAVMV